MTYIGVGTGGLYVANPCFKSLAGKFNRQIVIERITETQDSDGNYTEVVTTVVMAMAMIKQVSGREVVYGNKVLPVNLTRFTIRYAGVGNVTESDRVSYNGSTYNIRRINNVNEQDYILEIDAERNIRS